MEAGGTWLPTASRIGVIDSPLFECRGKLETEHAVNEKGFAEKTAGFSGLSEHEYPGLVSMSDRSPPGMLPLGDIGGGLTRDGRRRPSPGKVDLAVRPLTSSQA